MRCNISTSRKTASQPLAVATSDQQIALRAVELLREALTPAEFEALVEQLRHIKEDQEHT